MTAVGPWWRHDIVRLIGCGVVSAGIYAWLFLRLFYLPALDLATLPTPDTAQHFRTILVAGGGPRMALFVGGLITVAVLYGYAWHVARRLVSERGLAIIIGFGAVFGLIFALMTPAMTSDLYDYAVRAKQIVSYGQNPMVDPVAAMAGDPWLRYIFWTRIPTPYGPVWLGIAALTYLLHNGDLIGTLLGFKLVSLAAFMACIALIDRILARIAPEQRAAGVLLFAWNPLVLIELLGNGHNDVLMLVPLLLSLWALVARRWLLVFPALALAALIKVTALLALPVLLIEAARQWRDEGLRVRVLGASLALAVVLVLAAYAVVWEGPETLTHITRGVGTVSNSPAAAVAWTARRFSIDQFTVANVLRLAGAAVAVLVAALLLRRVWTWEPLGSATVLRTCFDLVALYLLLGSAWFWPWYATWLVALATVVMHTGRQRAAMTFSVLLLVLYLIPHPFVAGAPYFGHVGATMLAFGACVGVLGWAAWGGGEGALGRLWTRLFRRLEANLRSPSASLD